MPTSPATAKEPTLSRPTRWQQHQTLRHQAYLERIRQLPKRMTDQTIAELVRRYTTTITAHRDGWPTGQGVGHTINPEDVRPTEAAAIANTTHGETPTDPAGELIDIILTGLAEMAGAEARIMRALDELNRGVGSNPGEFEAHCRNCGDRASAHPDKPGWRLVLERCDSCYRYWHKHGDERPLGRKVG